MSCSRWGCRCEEGGNGVMGPFPHRLEAMKQLLADILAVKPSQIPPGWGEQVASCPKTIQGVHERQDALQAPSVTIPKGIVNEMAPRAPLGS